MKHRATEDNSRLKTMYLAKDMRIISDNYRKRYDEVEWNDTKVCKKCWHTVCQCG